MGFKNAKRAWTFCFVVALLLPINCKADTCTDLYSLYGMEYRVQYPAGTIETIQSYNYAEKYLTMYYNIAKCEYGTSELVERQKSITSRMAELEEKLSYGYYLTLSEIRSLESEYLSLEEQLSNVEKSILTYDMNTDIIDSSSIPTKDTYNDALLVKSEVDTQATLGDVKKVKRPFNGKSLLKDEDDESITFSVANRTEVVALFNGVIESVDDNGIVLNCHNGIKVYYTGVKFPSVSVEQLLSQYDVIGLSSNTVKVSLQLDDSFVDISKLLE